MQSYSTRSHVPDDGRSLLAVDQYECELKHLLILGEAEESALLSRAMLGDQEARSAMITGCLRYIYKVALSYALKYDSEDDVMDLVQAGNEAIVRYLTDALRSRNAYGYLRGVARHAMVHFGIENKLIRVPYSSHHKGYRAPLTVSLEAPMYEDRTVLDLLEDADWQGLREPVCDAVGCEQDATSFDGKAVEFRCDDHRVEVQA